MTSAHRALTEYRTDTMTALSGDGFGTVLRRLRLAAGLTQEALAERAGISARAVSDLERDPSRRPRLETVNLLADALRLPSGQRADLLSAARSPDPACSRAAGIPRPLDALIGRAEVTAEAAGRLGQAGVRLLTLTGPGGVGKTRIALEVAARVAAGFPDGAVWVDLSVLRDPGLVIPAIARALGLGEHDALPVLERLTSVARRKRLLVVLDNFEHLLPARSELFGLLTACPEIVILVTSRVVLRLRGEHEYHVLPLEVSRRTGAARSAAAELFAERARGLGVELAAGDEEAVDEICRRLEGIPLAIELAAARLRLLSPGELVQRLEPRLPLLTIGPEDLPARQRTMRDAITWSYQLLSERQRAVFRALCVFAGGWTLEAARLVSTAPALEEDLAGLVEASLVHAQRGEPGLRFALMETIREFGREQSLAAGELPAAMRRHAGYFVALAESGPSSLPRELDNLRAALRWAIEEQDAENALRLCAAMWQYWSEQGHLAEGMSWIRNSLALPGVGDVPVPARIAALTGAATMATDLSCFDEAAQAADQAVALARRAGAPHDLTAALNTRGRLTQIRDRYADALADYEQALELAESGGDAEGRARALIGLSFVTFFTGDPRAQRFAELGLAATRETGSRRDLGNALFSLLRQAMHTGDVGRMEAFAAEAVDVFRALGDARNTAEALRGLGTVAAFREDYERADRLLGQSAALYRDSGDERLASQVLGHLGMVALNIGDLPRARQLCSESLESARRFDDRWAIAMSSTLLGHAELAAGQIQQADECFQEGAAVFRAIGNPLFLSWCLEGLAGVAAARGHCVSAARLCASRDTLLSSLSASLPPAYSAGYRRTLDQIEAELGPALQPPASPLAAYSRAELTIATE